MLSITETITHADYPQVALLRQVSKCHKCQHPLSTSVCVFVYFHASSVAASLSQSASIIGAVLVVSNTITPYDSYASVYVAGYFSHLLMLLCLLSTIIFRLVTTFRETTFQISPRTRYVFFLVLLTMFVIICAETVTILLPIDYKTKYQSIFVANTIYLPMYIITSIYAVHLFSRNLLHLASTEAVSAIANDRLTLATSRYLACFLVAMSSTFILYGYAYIVWYFERESNEIIHDTIRGVVFMTDQCVNQICLLLQYKFAKKYYYRFCTVPDRCCLWLIDRKMSRHEVHGLDKGTVHDDAQDHNAKSPTILMTPTILQLAPVASSSCRDNLDTPD